MMPSTSAAVALPLLEPEGLAVTVGALRPAGALVVEVVAPAAASFKVGAG